MSNTYAIAQLAVQTALQDPSGLIYTSTILDALMPRVVSVVSGYVPRRTKEAITTVNNTKSMTLTAGLKYGLLSGPNGWWIEKLEYPIKDEPLEKVFQMFTQWGNVIRLTEDGPTPDGEDAYLYMGKKHFLQKSTGASVLTAWALDADHAVGVTELGIDHATATGTIIADTALTITGDTTATTYHVIETATIATLAATVKIAPPLAEAALENAVVTLALATPTMDDVLDEIYIEYCVGEAMTEKALSFGLMNRQDEVNNELYQIGLARRGEALARLRNITKKAPASVWGE